MQAFQLLRQGSLIIGAILLPNLGVDQRIIGAYEQLQYIGYSLSFFWVAGLVQGLLSSHTDFDESKQKRFLFNAYGLFMGLSFIIFCLLLCFPEWIFSIFTKGQPVPFYYLFSIYLLLNTPCFLLENIFLLYGKYRNIYYYGFYSFLGYLTAILLPIILGYDFRYAFLGLIIMALLKHVYLIVLIGKRGKWRFDYSLLKFWITLSSPLILYAFLGGLMQTFDAWIINYWYNGDPEKFAIFRYGARELPLVLALSAAFGSTMLPEIRRNRAEAMEKIKQKSLTLFHLLIPLSLVLLAFSNYWFPMVFTESFNESVIIFDTYLVIICSRLIFSRTILIGLQDNQMVLFISAAELILNIALSVYLISFMGLFGVALATLIAYSVEKLFLCFYLWYRHGIPLGKYLNISWWSLYTALVLFLFILKVKENFSFVTY